MECIQWFAAKYANAHDVFFVGSSSDYAACLVGCLKLKEISYIHSGAYAVGELKHETISLIEPRTLVIGILAVIPLQLTGYYVSVTNGLDVDKPKNLAKSVIVE